MILSYDSIILETDGAAIASRVSRPRTDTTDIIINEQTIMNACKSLYLSHLSLHLLLLSSCIDSSARWESENEAKGSKLTTFL
jgi:hypothetical protein